MNVLQSKTVLGLLVAMVLVVCAYGVVTVKHLNRVAYYDLQKQQHQRDALAVEWEQLTAEFSTWRIQNNVGAKAKESYSMVPPSKENVATLVQGTGR